ncbi:MAG: hypothetical protein KUG61_05085 [Parvibaculaceae bacterium]|nr:hypothetical protein [Parvibaculaceae bacterium]
MNVSPTIPTQQLQGAAQAATGEAVRAREFVTAKAIDPVVAAHQAALAKAGMKNAAEKAKKKKSSGDVENLDEETLSSVDQAALFGSAVVMSNETLIDAQSGDLMAEALQMARIDGQMEMPGLEGLQQVVLAQIPLVVLLEAQDSYEAVSSVMDDTPKSLYFKRK